MIFQILRFFIAENPNYMPYFSLASHMIILSAILFLSILQVNYPQGFPNREGPSVLWFFETPHQNWCPHGAPPSLTMKLTSLQLKNNLPLKMIPRKKNENKIIQYILVFQS